MKKANPNAWQEPPSEAFLDSVIKGKVEPNPAQILALAIACRELTKIVEAAGLAKWREK